MITKYIIYLVLPYMKKTESELTGVKEIARRANVSIGTVDRVIHNRKGVSENTKQKINSIIEELNFQPNKMASLLASRLLELPLKRDKTSRSRNKAIWRYR
jgi:hypothetical protein